MQERVMPGVDRFTARAWSLWGRIDKPSLVGILIVLLAAVLVPSDLGPILAFVLQALAKTGIFIFFAVLLIAGLKATSAESILARSFQGNELRMIVFASLVGGLAPFCSCEVIPFIAALLAAGTPISAVMAFWLSSPVMDPPMFMITAGALGLEFAVAKTVAAVGFGILGGVGTMMIGKTGTFSSSLRNNPLGNCCACPSGDTFSGRPVWRFWPHQERRIVFRDTFLWNSVFLLKWMTLAYLLEAIMIWYVPSEIIVGLLGGDGIWPILAGAVIGGPAYLNGYAAVPLVAGMLEQGMSPGASMAFVLAGSVTSIPAAVAVWALVKPKVFALYIGYAVVGSIIAGILWNLVA